MNENKDLHNMTVPKLPQIATVDRKADAKTFDAWLDENRAALTPEQERQAEFVRLSFKMVEKNLKNLAAFDVAQRMHAADVAKLQALLG